MKEKDRALQVGYQQSDSLPSFVSFIILKVIACSNNKNSNKNKCVLIELEGR